MFTFDNLDNRTRQYMLIEVEAAIKESRLNFSKRFNTTGLAEYPRLLREATTSGTEQTLAIALAEGNCFQATEKQGAVTRKVRADAPLIFAEGEFNNFYMKAVCHRAIGEGHLVEVYRAKEVATPRKDSALKEGQQLDPKQVLLLLKNSADGSQRGPTLPSGSSSGLSIRLL